MALSLVTKPWEIYTVMYVQYNKWLDKKAAVLQTVLQESVQCTLSYLLFVLIYSGLDIQFWVLLYTYSVQNTQYYTMVPKLWTALPVVQRHRQIDSTTERDKLIHQAEKDIDVYKFEFAISSCATACESKCGNAFLFSNNGCQQRSNSAYDHTCCGEHWKYL